MSTILKALKRLESENELEAARAREADELIPARRARPKRRWLGVVSGVLIALVSGTATYWAVLNFGTPAQSGSEGVPLARIAPSSNAQRTPGAVSSPRDPGLSAPPRAAAPAAPMGRPNAQPATESPVHVPAAGVLAAEPVETQVRDDAKVRETPQSRPVPEAGGARSVASLPLVPTSVISAERVAPVREAAPSGRPVPQATDAAPVKPVVQVAAAAPDATAEARLPTVRDVERAHVAKRSSPRPAPLASSEKAPTIPAGGAETELVEIHLVQTIWHPTAEKRHASIRLSENGRAVRVNEGEEIAGFRVERISPSSVTLEKAGVTITRRVGE